MAMAPTTMAPTTMTSTTTDLDGLRRRYSRAKLQRGGWDALWQS
ncbi:MAG TPA: hypothetical protein VF194_12290 [Ferrovibrio sp.]